MVRVGLRISEQLMEFGPSRGKLQFAAASRVKKAEYAAKLRIEARLQPNASSKGDRDDVGCRFVSSVTRVPWSQGLLMHDFVALPAELIQNHSGRACLSCSGALESFTPRSVHVITLKQTQALHWIAKLGTFERAAAKLNANLKASSRRLPRQ
jgi:hypothetical protein